MLFNVLQGRTDAVDIVEDKFEIDEAERTGFKRVTDHYLFWRFPNIEMEKAVFEGEALIAGGHWVIRSI